MQLRVSIAAATIIISMTLEAEDYVSVQYLQYDETLNRTSVSAPSLMINKDFGIDYTLNANIVLDSVSGASETYYDGESLDSVSGASETSNDGASGASAFLRGKGLNAKDVEYGNIKYSDKRAAGGLSFTKRFANRDELIVGANYSTESDFYSKEVSAEYMHWLRSSKNSSLSFGLSYQKNEILVSCKENSACDAQSGASEKMKADVLNVQASYFQNIDTKSYAKVSLFYIADSGYLSNPYLNVIRNYKRGATADVLAEVRPDARVAYGTMFKYAYALRNDLSLHLSYRYYSDDWEIASHTVDSDLYYELGDEWIFKLGLRYYTQSGASFYNGTIDYFTDETYASSDQRLSKFDAITYKTSVNYTIAKDLSLNLGVSNYYQSTGIQATYFTTGFRYNF